jgi:D-alanyl-D-alanine carboxypeptidase
MVLYNKNKFKVLLLLVLSVLFFSLPVKAQVSLDYLYRQIVSLEWDISLLQSLVANLESQKIFSPSYLAVDLSNGNILLEKNSGKVYPIASVTKLMSAVVALENIDTKKEIVLTEKMLEPYGHSPCLFAGLKISAENLIKASLVQSVNDASEALTYFIGREKFLSLMNLKAKEIEMTNTFFNDPHGLSLNNVSTASDLVKLLDYIFKNHPEILAISKNNNFWLTDENGSLLKFRNVNNFYLLPDFIGGKTGYLPEAGQTLASIFEKKGFPIAIIVLDSSNRQADAFAILKQVR